VGDIKQGPELVYTETDWRQAQSLLPLAQSDDTPMVDAHPQGEEVTA